MMTDNMRARSILGFALFLALLMNGLYFMMPYDAVNPYEYLHGINLSTFLALDIFIGGAVVPLIALVGGYLLHSYRGIGVGNLAKVLGFLLALGIVHTFFVHAFDFLPGLALMGLVTVLFVRAHWSAPLFSGLALFAVHLTANVLVGFFTNIGSPTDIIYTAMQDVTEYTSVFRDTDYFAIVAMNIEIFSQNALSSLYGLIFTVLPWLLIGLSFGKLDVVRMIAAGPVMAIVLFVVLAGGGIAMKMAQVLTLGSYSGRLLAENFGGPVLALGYFFLLAYATIVLPGRIIGVFSRAGRYIVTLYVLSNIMFMLVFYGIGMRLYGEMEISSMIWLASAVYIFLLVLSAVMEKYNVKGIEHLFANNSENDMKNKRDML